MGLRNFYVTICLILSVFVTLTILLEFYRGARVISARGNTNSFRRVAQLTMRNTRRYGGYVVHFGIVLIFIGISGAAFNQDKQMEMPPGAQMTIGPYHLTQPDFRFSTQVGNYTAGSRHHRRRSRRQANHHALSREAPVSGQPGIGNHGGHLLDAQGRSLRGLRRPQPGNATSR